MHLTHAIDLEGEITSCTLLIGPLLLISVDLLDPFSEIKNNSSSRSSGDPQPERNIRRIIL